MTRKHTAQLQLRKAYGGPLAKKAGQKIPLTRDQLRRSAEILLESIKEEIRRDMALVTAIRGPGAAVQLPQTRRFPESFTFRLKGASTIEILSDWPTASAHVNKLTPGSIENQRPDTSAPIEMRWLMAPKVPLVRIVQADGQVVIRTTPLSKNQSGPWIHPGFQKYTFLERGLRKGRIKAAEALAVELVTAAIQTYNPFPEK